MTLDALHALDPVLSRAMLAHPSFAAAARDGETPLLTLSCLVGEGLAELDVASVERRVDFLSYLVGRECLGREHPRRRLDAMRRILAEEEGFRGDTERYDDPSNSFVGSVLERRRGLPITLSVIYLAVGARLGWPLAGVDFPLHFMVRYLSPEGLLVIDPFGGGRLMDLEQCLAKARPAFAALEPRELHQAVRARLEGIVGTPRIVARMLRNLALSYERRGDWPSVRNVLEKMIILHPASGPERRDLGRVLHALGEPELALDCLRSYLALEPAAGDRRAVQADAERLERRQMGE